MTKINDSVSVGAELAARITRMNEMLMLTDAEREAVETSFDAMQYAADELGLSQGDCDQMVTALRGLLERTKAEELVDARTVSEPGAALRVTAVPIPPKIQAAMAAAIRRPFP